MTPKTPEPGGHVPDRSVEEEDTRLVSSGQSVVAGARGTGTPTADVRGDWNGPGSPESRASYLLYERSDKATGYGRRFPNRYCGPLWTLLPTPDSSPLTLGPRVETPSDPRVGSYQSLPLGSSAQGPVPTGAPTPSEPPVRRPGGSCDVVTGAGQG